MQSATDNGWHPFEHEITYKFGVGKSETFKTTTADTLQHRFHCMSSKKTTGHCSLTDIDLFENDDELRDILGYVNTAKDKQHKGVSGGVR